MAKAKPLAVKDGKPVFAYNAQERPVCGYHKRDGTLCQSEIRMANGRCRIHKGDAAKGMLAPNYKGGTASVIFKALPEKLRRGYLASLTDEQQISLEAGIAVLDANTLRILHQLEAGVGGDVYKRLSEHTEQLDALLDYPDCDIREARREWQTLLAVIEAGTREAALWAQVQANLEQRRKLTETQQKLLTLSGNNITAKEMDTFVATVLNIVKTTAKDPRERASMGRKIVALIDPVAAAKMDVAADAAETSRALAIAESIPAELKPEIVPDTPKPVRPARPARAEKGGPDVTDLSSVIDPLAE